jgi:hypothetical protein
MVGQINWLIKGDQHAAEAAYKEMLVLAEASDPKTNSQRDVWLSEAYEKLAIGYQQQQRFSESTAMRKKQLELPVVAGPRRQIAMLENARDFLAAKKTKESLATFDEFLTTFPDYGHRDGNIVNILLERVEAHGLGENDPKRIGLLEQIWKDDKFRKFPQVLNVGREIVGLADSLRDRATVSRVAEEWLSLFDTNFKDLSREDLDRFHIEDSYAQVVITLAGIDEVKHGPLVPIAQYTRFLTLFPNGKWADYIQSELKRLKERANYSPEDKITGFGAPRQDRALQTDIVSSLTTVQNSQTHSASEPVAALAVDSSTSGIANVTPWSRLMLIWCGVASAMVVSFVALRLFQRHSHQSRINH